MKIIIHTEVSALRRNRSANSVLVDTKLLSAITAGIFASLRDLLASPVPRFGGELMLASRCKDGFTILTRRGTLCDYCTIDKISHNTLLPLFNMYGSALMRFCHVFSFSIIDLMVTKHQNQIFF